LGISKIRLQHGCARRLLHTVKGNDGDRGKNADHDDNDQKLNDSKAAASVG